MARLGLTHNLAWYVREPTIGQQLIGLVPIRCLIAQTHGIEITYYDYTREVSWCNTGNYLHHHLRFRNDRNAMLSRMCKPNGNYTITQDGFTFSYNGSQVTSDARFTSRYRIESWFDICHVGVLLQLAPVSVTKKLQRPDIKLDGTVEDAELALKYFLDLRDQMIKLGY